MNQGSAQNQPQSAKVPFLSDDAIAHLGMLDDIEGGELSRVYASTPEQAGKDLEAITAFFASQPSAVRASLASLIRRSPLLLSDWLANVATEDPETNEVADLFAQTKAASDRVLARLQATTGPWQSLPVALEGPWFEAGPHWTLGELLTAAFPDGDAEEQESLARAEGREVLADALNQLATSETQGLDALALASLREFASNGLDVAIQKMLWAVGVLRGPCPRCERPEWVTKYRPPKSRGRVPLDHSYCPECVEAIKREQWAESKRRARSEGRAH